MSKAPDRAVSGEAAEDKAQTGPNTSPQQDPAEGSRETIDRELERADDKEGTDEAERSRRDLEKQVAEETELPGRGSA
jgi:hypothetical protein